MSDSKLNYFIDEFDYYLLCDNAYIYSQIIKECNRVCFTM
jgi:hypothetical protein